MKPSIVSSLFPSDVDFMLQRNNSIPRISHDRDAISSHGRNLKAGDFLAGGGYSSDLTNFSIEEPLNSQTCQERKQLLTTEIKAASIEKLQFIANYFNSNGNPDTQHQSIEAPLNSVLTEPNKKALITAIQQGLLDFDIKMRFLTPEELALISSFPKGYFTNPKLKLSKKAATRLIGNAVPPEWARLIIEPVAKELRRALDNQTITAAA